MKEYIHIDDIDDTSFNDFDDIKSIVETLDYGFMYHEHFEIDQINDYIRIAFTKPQQEYLIIDLVKVLCEKGYAARC